MKHAGIHWPENAGGEHPNRETIISMPGMQGAFLICSPSARWHWNAATAANPEAARVWRGIPEPGQEPARLKWNAQKIADACLLHWDEQSHGGWEWFTPLNELQFDKENGGPFPGYGVMAQNLGRLRDELRKRLPSNVRLLFPAWVPTDDGDHLGDWQGEAYQWDAIGLHCYGSAETMRARYQSYRDAFPHHPLFVGEWNSNHEGHDESASLQMWADVAKADPLFLGAAYFIWETNNAGEGDLSIWGNADRLALFRDPPRAAEEPEKPKPTTDPYEHWTAKEIVGATGCPIEAVREHWPRLVGQLDLCGINDKMVQAAMIGTVAIESASTFSPVREAFWLDEDWRRTHLRYYPFYGRGFIQITWEANYATYGQAVNDLWDAGDAINLVVRPDDALDPDISAAIAAVYFRDHGREDGSGIPEAARAGDWREVRRLVQGADAGLDRLVAIVTDLGVTAPVEPTERTYGPDVPDGVIFQQNSWTCAVRSTYAALWAMAEQGQADPVTYGDTGPRDVYAWLVPQWDKPDIGLLDHTGAGLAEALRAHGYDAKHYYAISLEAVRDVAGAMPVLLGGDAWNHWVYVRGRTNDGGLVLENPSPGHAGISDYLRDSFDRLGPMAAVVIDLAPVVEPSTYAVGPGILAKMAEHGDKPATDEAYYGQEYSEAFGMSGSRYVYLKVTNTTYRFDPAA